MQDYIVSRAKPIQAQIVNVTGIIIYFTGIIIYLTAMHKLRYQNGGVHIWVMRFHFRGSVSQFLKIMFFEPFWSCFPLLKGQNQKTAGIFLFLGLQT